MWYQTARKPMMNGYATFSRPATARTRLLAVPQSPAAIARLRALGVRYVVLDRGGTAALPRPTPSLCRRGRFTRWTGALTALFHLQLFSQYAARFIDSVAADVYNGKRFAAQEGRPRS